MLFSASMGGLLLLCLLPLLRCLVGRVHALALRNQRVQHVHDVHAVLLPLGVPLTDQRQLAIVRVVPADDITPYSTVIKAEFYENMMMQQQSPHKLLIRCVICGRTSGRTRALYAARPGL